MSEIRQKADEKSISEIILGNVSQNPRVESKEDVLESTTLSQMVVSHEEEILAQSFGEPSDEELDEWTNNRADDEQWGRDGVHEDDIILITKDRRTPTPTNNDCISNIYGYEEVDDPTMPTAIFYRYCKPQTSLEEVQRRENFRERRRE